jgi:hypothetical protein
MNEGWPTLVAADVFDSLSNFFDSPVWTVLRILLIVFVILMWLALGVWVFRDARRRNNAPGYPRLMAAIALIIPFLGPLLYIAIRPAETLAEQRERQLEAIGLEWQGGMRCPDCGYPADPRWLACPSCMRKLKSPCTSCGEPIDPRWSICPFCETVPPGALARPADQTLDFPAITQEPAQ